MSDKAGLIVGNDGCVRCAWSGHDSDYQRYHDEEWGAPVFIKRY